MGRILTVFVSDKNVAAEHLVVFEDVLQHLLVQTFGGRLKRDLHAPRLLLLQVDVAESQSVDISVDTLW